MDGFVDTVTRQLEQVRDLFGLPTQVITAVTPDSAGLGLLANWSGASSQGHDEAVSGVGSQHGALGDADAVAGDGYWTNYCPAVPPHSGDTNTLKVSQ